MKRFILVCTGLVILCILILTASVYGVFPQISAHAALVPKADQPTQVNRFGKKIIGGGWVIDAIQTTDGGFLSLSREISSSAFIVRKTKLSGEPAWARSLQLGVIHLNAIAETSDGYVLAGYVTEFTSFYYYYFSYFPIIVKLDRNGRLVQHSKIIGTGLRFFSEIVSNPDGSFVTVGQGSTVIKFGSAGQILWAKTYRFRANTCCFHVQRTPDNSIILAKYLSTGADVIKLNALGAKIWANRVKAYKFGVHASGFTSNNGLILAGKCIDCGDLMLVTLDSNGKLAWTARYSLNLPHFLISRVIPTEDGGYSLTGSLLDKAGTRQSGFVFKIDSLRNVVFLNRFGIARNSEESKAMFSTANHRYVVIGSSGRNDALFLNLDSNGTLRGCTLMSPLTSAIALFGDVTIDHLNVSVSKNSNVSTGFLSLSSDTLVEHFEDICP
jgi:hypothetical protein